MDEFSIVSFKYGLDTRRDVLTSQPGTLVVCENAHINPGGELEKRKAFDAYKNAAILDGNGDTGTFGLEVTDAGLMVFGSALPFGTTPSQSQPVLASAMPSGVTYQQLIHPSLVNDTTENYNRLYHRITAIKFSENYQGKAFVSALFSDGRIFLYNNGILVQQSANGLVMEGRVAVSDLSNDLARQITVIDWTTSANTLGNSLPVEAIIRVGTIAHVTLTGHGYLTNDQIEIIGAIQPEYNGIFTITVIDANNFDYTVMVSGANPVTPATGSSIIAIKQGVTQNGSTIIQSPPFDMFTPLPEETSTLGQIGAKQIAHDGAAVGGVKAYAGFQITANTGPFTVSAPQTASAQTPQVDLCGGSITAAATAKLTADLIVACVNDLTYVHGYSASSVNDNVFVFAPLSFGVFALDLVVTGATTGAATTSPGTLLATISPSPLTVIKIGTAPTAKVSGSATCSPFNGTAPYSFLWSEQSPGSGDGITFINGSTATPTFSRTIALGVPPLGQGYFGTFKCEVTDTTLKKITVNLNVFLEYRIP